MIKICFFIISYWLLGMGFVNAQAITIEDCYRLAGANYPAIKKMELISKTTGYEMENAGKRFLPQVSFSGQATYQSQVVDYEKLFGGIALPPGITPPTLSKDQYRIQGEISQLLYDAGSTRNQKDMIIANNEIQEQNLETNLYAIKDRINSIYFSVLLTDAQLKQNELNRENLQTQVQKTEAALRNGTAFRSSLDELKAEIVNIEMAGTTLKSNRTALLKMLSLFIGKELSAVAELTVPVTEVMLSTMNRPELKLFDLQRSVYDVQRKVLKSAYLPQVNAFFQGAYGRPTLNIIENKFGAWYMGGVRFNWSLGSLYSLANKKNILMLNQKSVEADRETFLFNTKLELTRQDENINKFTELIKQDDEAIALRSSVAKAAGAQLNNGVITTHEYIQKVNAEHLARQNKILHQVQLLQAKYNQKFITGN